MHTFKQHYLKETGWNPRQDVTTAGHGVLSPRQMKSQGGKSREDIESNIDAAEQMIRAGESNPAAVENKLLELGKDFDSLLNTRAEDLKYDILTKVRQLKQLMKHRNHHECVTICRYICDLIFEG